MTSIRHKSLFMQFKPYYKEEVFNKRSEQDVVVVLAMTKLGT